MKKFFRNNSLSIVFLILFVVTLFLQSITGFKQYNSKMKEEGGDQVSYGSYFLTGHFIEATTCEGELHIQHVTAFHISALMEYNGMSLREACRYFLHEKCKNINGDMGLIAVDTKGNLVAEFNTPRMHRAMKSSSQGLIVEIYPK